MDNKYNKDDCEYYKVYHEINNVNTNEILKRNVKINTCIICSGINTYNIEIVYF